MNFENFIVVGENIHCTRIVKRGGIKMTTTADGQEAVKFKVDGEERLLAAPTDWGETSPDYEKGKCKHVALAIHQALNGDSEAVQAGTDYLCYVAERQLAKGATFLDVNVDEYSSDLDLTIEIMDWLTKFLGERYEARLSIDSSSPKTLATGLSNCRPEVGAPMVNSVSLEREEAIDVVKQFGAEAIVGATGRSDMPADAAARMANLREVLGIIAGKGIDIEKLHLDPLVLPVSVDSNNGKHFLEATAAARDEFAGVHLNGGLSNISFGMPQRKLLNMVFIWLCVEAGTDGGIIDPVVMPISSVAKLDPDSEPFGLAKAMLTGEDMFGMEFITAFRDGRLNSKG